MRGMLIVGGVLAVSLGLGACGTSERSLSDTLGYERGPDASNVAKRPPLTIPPDYNLRPHAEGEEPQDPSLPDAGTVSDPSAGSDPALPPTAAASRGSRDRPDAPVPAKRP